MTGQSDASPRRAPGSIRQVSSRAVLLEGAAVVRVAMLVKAGIRARRSHGVLPSRGDLDLLGHLVDMADQAEPMATDGHADVREGVGLAALTASQVIGVEEAAELLGRSPRQVRRLAPTLGTRGAHEWRLDRDAVVALAAEMQEARAAQTPPGGSS